MELKSLLRELLKPLIEEEIEAALERDSKNIERHFRKKAMESSSAFITQHMPDAVPLPHKWALLDQGLEASTDIIAKHPQALVCEFGVATGSTINYIAKALPETTIYGFDSFEGLPEDWRDGYPKGAFSRTAPPEVENNVTLVQGYFDQTLVPFLEAHSAPAALLHIDCDLYSSTRTIFQAFSQHLMPGSVLVFDEYFNYPDWEHGEHLALNEYLEESGLAAQYLGYCKFHQQVVLRLISQE